MDLQDIEYPDKFDKNYLRKIHNKDKEIKLISERHIDENDINY